MDEDITLDMDTQPSAPADVPAERKAWGNFKLLARVGYGGFGEVYKAWDSDLEREVALKLLLPSPTGKGQSGGQNDDEYKAILREARALASVRHANIVPVYGIDRHDGRVGFWTDFVKGRTLTSLLASQGPFGYREAAMIGLDVTRALSAVHRAGILHRDIKADNVMREEGGRILLMDFGLSTLPHREGNTAGTPNYMAPELWQGHAASVESDIYAMGVLLFYLVTREYPAKLGGLSIAEAMTALARRRTLMDMRSDLPEPFLRAVSKATENDPARRYSSAGQMAEALSECLGTAAVPVQSEAANAPETAHPPKSSRWVVGVVATAVVLGTVGLKAPAVRRVLHLDASTEKTARMSPSSSSLDSSDQYMKAKALLRKSYKDSNIAEAIAIFKGIPETDPNFALAQAGLGAAYFLQYKNSDDDSSLRDLAKVATTRALDRDPKLAPARVTMAQIYASTGNNDLALTTVNDVIDSNSRSPEAYAAKAKVYESQGNLKDAIKTVQSAIDIDGDNSMWWVQRGDYYKSDGDIEAAAKDWQTAIEKDPEDIFAYYDLGIADQVLDKLPEARRNFQEVLQLAPKDEYSLRALGTVYQLEGNYSEAEKTDKDAIALDSNDYEAWTNLGNVYAWSGFDSKDKTKHAQAMEAYSKAIGLAERLRSGNSNSVELVIALANLYASVGDKERSLPLIRKALGLAKGDPSVQYLAGYSYELLGMRRDAITLIAKSIAQGGPTSEMKQSPELASLRRDPQFFAAVGQAKADIKVDRKNKLN